MAYDEELAERVRELLAPESGLSERRMFGGLAFLLAGNMAVAVSPGGLLVRVDPDELEKLLKTTQAEVAVMGSREMHGWVRVDAEQLRTARQLRPWVQRGVARSRSYPPKS